MSVSLLFDVRQEKRLRGHRPLYDVCVTVCVQGNAAEKHTGTHNMSIWKHLNLTPFYGTILPYNRDPAVPIQGNVGTSIWANIKKHKLCIMLPHIGITNGNQKH